jgi:hypothetical protein
MAARVTAADPGPGRHLLDKIDAREQALAREAEQAQPRIDELTARLRELPDHPAYQQPQGARPAVAAPAGIVRELTAGLTYDAAGGFTPAGDGAGSAPGSSR